MFLAREDAKPPHLRRSLPDDPTATGGRALPLDERNRLAADAFNDAMLAKCENCGRTFLPDKLVVHQRSCRPGNTAKPVGAPTLGGAGAPNHPMRAQRERSTSPRPGTLPRAATGGPASARPATPHGRASQQPQGGPASARPATSHGRASQQPQRRRGRSTERRSTTPSLSATATPAVRRGGGGGGGGGSGLGRAPAAPASSGVSRGTNRTGGRSEDGAPTPSRPQTHSGMRRRPSSFRRSRSADKHVRFADGIDPGSSLTAGNGKALLASFGHGRDGLDADDAADDDADSDTLVVDGPSPSDALDMTGTLRPGQLSAMLGSSGSLPSLDSTFTSKGESGRRLLASLPVHSGSPDNDGHTAAGGDDGDDWGSHGRAARRHRGSSIPRHRRHVAAARGGGGSGGDGGGDAGGGGRHTPSPPPPVPPAGHTGPLPRDMLATSSGSLTAPSGRPGTPGDALKDVHSGHRPRHAFTKESLDEVTNSLPELSSHAGDAGSPSPPRPVLAHAAAAHLVADPPPSPHAGPRAVVASLGKPSRAIVEALEARVLGLQREMGEVLALLHQLKASMG